MDEIHCTFPEKKRWSYRPRFMSIMERTSPLRRRHAVWKNKITMIGPSGSNQPTSVVWTEWMIPPMCACNGWNCMKESMSIVQISIFKCKHQDVSNGPILLPNRFTKTSPSRVNVLGWKTRKILDEWGRNFFETEQLCGISQDDLQQSSPDTFGIWPTATTLYRTGHLWKPNILLMDEPASAAIRSRQHSGKPCLSWG